MNYRLAFLLAFFAILGTGVPPEGDNQLHGFRGDTGQPLFSGPAQGMRGLRHFQTLIATEERLYVAADAAVYAFGF
jgi:hypothetical protein